LNPNIDSVNWKILRELQHNARITYAEIGKIAGLTAPAVAQRIQKMEDEGIISGYHIGVDLEKVGLAVTAIIQMGQLKCDREKVLNALKSIPAIIECHSTTGNTCFFLKAAVPSVKDLQELLESLVPYGYTTTSVILDTPIPPKVIYTDA
jgi:Lrp/AsnC family transcriptional regulator, leucine-responsive regulatory protein